jgi:hypothetical protein
MTLANYPSLFRGSKAVPRLTSLFDEEITGSDTREACKLRWNIEDHFKVLKRNFLGKKFRTKSFNGVH